MQLINTNDGSEPSVLLKYLTKFKIKPENQITACARWAIYFGEANLENLQQLCEDLDITDDLSSKTKCNQALRKVNVNIPQFLKAMAIPSLQVIKFSKRRELTAFTIKKGKKKDRMFHKNDIPKGCPLRKLLKEMF